MKGYAEFKGLVGGIINEITSWAMQFACLAMALLILAAVSAAAGYPIRFAPVVEHTKLAYMAGAMYLMGRR